MKSQCSEALDPVEPLEPVETDPVPAPLSPLAATQWAAELEEVPAREVLAAARRRFPSTLALCTSFQAEGMVLLDLLSKLGIGGVTVLSLDTGRLPPETFDHIERVRRHYGVDVELVSPDAAEVRELVRHGGPNLFFASVQARHECCRVRKVEPLRRALLPYEAWLTGLRRDQTPSRERIPKVVLDEVNAPDRPLYKISPLADWSHEDVWTYLRTNQVPYHPLYDQGYLSIGCAPCTRPSRPAEDARAGRWWWEQDGSRECGLHVLHPLGQERPAPPQPRRLGP